MKKISDAFAIEIMADPEVHRVQFELLPTDDSGPSMFSLQGADEDFPAHKTIRVGRGDRLTVTYIQSDREKRLETVLREMHHKIIKREAVPASAHEEARTLLGLEGPSKDPRSPGRFNVSVTENQRKDLLTLLTKSKFLDLRYKDLADNAVPDGVPVVGDQVKFHRNIFSLECQWNGEEWVIGYFGT